ncbi:MAG TPA: DUF2231 domain-containing protein [Candidatus Binatus sp.]|uniref:DUF2231 domain-containing protein n=1 Tax=Candidatus Binatus sp. TaxID=2811406 RepID=UPI002B45A73B|nr:DUF2231 domain-containing protein [Candidatus Binatus sp.]HKN13686.1 DUF2231 domain-containing protein [Candidatus Binatus sp.]
MDAVVKFLQPYQLHPVVDHFSVALLFVAVLIDLVASAAPNRIWLRYTALTLMILGALAAGGSFATGDMEADRIWNALGQPAREVLKRHSELGEYLAITFGILALWRILIQAFGFMAGSRAIYLIVAVLAIATLGYSAHLGGELVYDYGAGTALMASAAVPSEAASPASAPTSSGPLPTVSVPTPQASSSAPPVPAASASNSTESPKPGSMPTPIPTVQPSAAPSAASM